MTRLAIRKLDDAGVSPLGNLVKADVHQCIVAAEDALAEAEAEGRRAVDAAATRGREAGEAEGRRAAAALMAETVAAAHGYLQDVQGRLADIVLGAVRRVLGEFDDEELVLRLVRQLVREAEGESRVRLRVSPSRLAAVRDGARALQAEFGVELIDVLADVDVEADGCRVETPRGFVNTGIGAQLDALRAALERSAGE